MGSLISSPKPRPVQTVYVPPSSPIQTVQREQANVQTSTAAQTNSNTDTSANTDDVAAAQSAKQVREQNLLSRSRGRLGTVLTGFRGVLSNTVNPSDRKTLLGE